MQATTSTLLLCSCVKDVKNWKDGRDYRIQFHIHEICATLLHCRVNGIRYTRCISELLSKIVQSGGGFIRRSLFDQKERNIDEHVP